MNTTAVASRIPEARYWQAALVGGMIAGTLDLISAFIAYGWGRAVARPMPLLPPVIRAFLPVSFIMPPFLYDRHQI